MTNTISAFHAVRLAELHHSVMTMVETGSGFRVNAMTTPRKLLQEYQALVKRLDVKLFNEHFLAHAWATVERIEGKAAEALKEI